MATIFLSRATLLVTCLHLSNMNSRAEGQIIFSPKVFKLGTDRQLDVQCFYQANSDQIDVLHNLSILFSKNEDITDFKTIATVDVKDVVDENVTDAEITGAVNQTGGSWLNITWAYPFQERGGVYKCVATGLNAAARDISSQSSVTIHAVEPKVGDLLELKDQLMKMYRLTDSQRRLQRSRSLLFNESEAYNGHRYYLSVKRFSTTEKESQASCELYGGYLAEYETEEEYQFIISFLSKFPSYTAVLVSGSDELTEGTWISQHTKRPLKLIKWNPGQPEGGRGENCIGFWKHDSWIVGDIPCAFNTDKYDHGYLCQIPETEA